MNTTSRERATEGLAVFSAGFRPFFLLAALWSALVVPLWLGSLTGHLALPTAMSPLLWHVHELIFGFGAAVVAGFLLTAVPNWTGRLPLRGVPLATLVLLWFVGRMAVLFSAWIGAERAMVLDLAFPVMFLLAVGREILAGRNWRNLPVVGALVLLLAGNLMIHLGGLGLPVLELPGAHLGVATLLMLISLIGGRIVPSFTRNWLVKNRPGTALPAPFGGVDRAALALTALALLTWVAAPGSRLAPWTALAGGLAAMVRLLRWRGVATLREPLLWVLHLGYAWLAVGLLLLAGNGFWPLLPASAALHALTAGAIGCMTLAVMTRASLGHTGRPLVAGHRTTAIYVLVTLAVVARLLAPLAGEGYLTALWLSGAAWSSAFGLFVWFYGPPLLAPRPAGGSARPI